MSNIYRLLRDPADKKPDMTPTQVRALRDSFWYTKDGVREIAAEGDTITVPKHVAQRLCWEGRAHLVEPTEAL